MNRPTSSMRVSPGTAGESGSVLSVCCAALVTARFLVPAESAAAGETLWIVVCWLGAAVFSLWLAARSGRLRCQASFADLCVAALCAGHAVSAATVFFRGGQQRAALNMLWEWVGIAVAWGLLRIALRTETARRRMTGLLLTIGILLAGFGVWQRFVWYPSIARDYREWEVFSQAPPGESAEDRLLREDRLRELRRKLGPQLLDLEGPAKTALRERVLASTEPFGRFGLANTFGGVLAALLIVAGGVAAAGWPFRSRVLAACAVLAVAGIGFALLLTKSRTAWLGAMLGGGLLLVCTRRIRPRDRRARIGMGLAALAVVASLAAGAWIVRDAREGIVKSVSYRLQYWEGAWDVIQTHPWLGVGPGNFRQAYLQFKRPEASEEIADPHNLFLDVWTSGGLLAFAGLCGLVGQIVVSLVHAIRLAKSDASGEEGATVTRSLGLRWLILAGLGAIGLSLGVTALVRGPVDWQLVALAACWLPCAFVGHRLMSAGASRGEPQLVCGLLCGAAALLLHLCGAGGIEMPVVTLLLLLLGVLVPGPTAAPQTNVASPVMRSPPSAQQSLATSTRTAYVAPAIALLLLVACILTGWLPVTSADLQLRSGYAALYSDRNAAAGIRYLEGATRSDPLDPDPWEALGLARFAVWQATSQADARDFDAGLQAVERAIALDPRNPARHRLLGDAWLRGFEQSKDPQAGKAAVEALRHAVDLYPNSSSQRSALADALSQTGHADEAAREAARALELDRINHDAGHTDKWLPEETRARLEQIASAGR